MDTRNLNRSDCTPCSLRGPGAKSLETAGPRRRPGEHRSGRCPSPAPGPNWCRCRRARSPKRCRVRRDNPWRPHSHRRLNESFATQSGVKQPRVPWDGAAEISPKRSETQEDSPDRHRQTLARQTIAASARRDKYQLVELSGSASTPTAELSPATLIPARCAGLFFWQSTSYKHRRS
jgi:hypothetical protein